MLTPWNEQALSRTTPADELLEMGDALLELGPDWRIVRVNTNQERLSRKRRLETVGRNIWDVFPEIATPTTLYWREYHRCMEERVPVQFQDYYAPLDLWTGVTAYPTSTGGVAIFFRDISAAKRLEHDQERLAEIVESSDDAIISKDVNGIVLSWNPAAERVFGYGAAEMIGSPIERLLPPDRRGEEKRILDELRAGHRIDHFETKRVRKDGAIIDVSVTVSPLLDDRGAVRGASKIARDITDRKRIAQALRESEEHLREYAELVKYAPVLARDRDDRIVVWNDGMEKLYGWSRDEAIGRVSHELFQTRFPQPLEEIVATMEREGRWEGELTQQRRDGSAVVVTSLWVGHQDREGNLRAVIEVDTDVTDRRHAEAALVAANEQLRETDRRRTEFLGVLSHELRNPLAPIRNSIFLLERLPADSPQATRSRQVISRQTEHLMRLVDDLLDVTRISRGKIQLQREVVDLRNVLWRTCEDHRALFNDAELELHLDFTAAPIWTDVDPTRIAQIIGNLLVNAKKFTPAGGAVNVALHDRAGHACICIRDSGIGMEPDRVAHMFEAFAQEDRSLARTRGGLGLGLALAKGLIELHGGTISARSEGPGKGSEFELTLPLSLPVRATPLTPEATPAAAAGRRVLVIEDDPDGARTLADVLELAGHHVTIARNGSTGVAVARQQNPDVVVCDIGLPDIDGYEVARTLRQDQALAGTRLIALSGYAQPEDIARAKEAGFDAHLPKPAPLEDLTAMLV